jgi:hypothetical protein
MGRIEYEYSAIKVAATSNAYSTGKKITEDDVTRAWNAQADQYNQWHSLDVDEKINFILQQANDEIERSCSEKLTRT